MIKAELPGIVTFKEKINIDKKIDSWSEILKQENLCHLCVVERYNKSNDYAHGFIKNFNLKSGAVDSSV